MTRRSLSEILSPARLTEVVDIGANPIDGDPPYSQMLSSGLCRVTGFEPQEQALQRLLQAKGHNERYLPYAIGDGAAHTLKTFVEPGLASLLEPDPVTIELFDVYKRLAVVTQRIPIQTRRLDDIDEVTQIDFLKIDAQGSELSVFKAGEIKLSQTVAIQTEVSFLLLYKNQPSIGEIDLELRRQGFLPHCFMAIKQWPISPFIVNNDPRLALNQLLEADMVYIRDISRPDLMSNEQLKHLALIAHHCYKSFDLALRCVVLLERRQALGIGAEQRYLQFLSESTD